MYAEDFHLLSDCQEGFQKHQNTMRALQSTLNVFEDAKLHQKNVFALYTDYSNAFKTIDQDKLLQSLFDLKFPHVAIDAVRDRYACACISVRNPAGITAPVCVERGVLQGDILSPFLFNCFLEPLARWLQAGGRGYTYGCLEVTKAAPKMQMKCQTPCSCYANDSFLSCNTIADLCLQAEKINEYASWGDLKIQPVKCAVTSMPHAGTASGAIHSPLSWVGNEQLKNRLAFVKIAPRQIPFAHPDKEPQKVLGVWVTSTRSWRHQQRKLIEVARERSEAISESWASPKHKLVMIQTSLKPYITYSFPLGIRSNKDINELDSMISRTAKRSLQLPMSTPTGLVWLPVDYKSPSLVLEQWAVSGSGAQSLLVEDVQLGTAYLLRASACTHRLVKGVYIERHNEDVATAGKAVMEGANGGCLAVLMADAGWHGKFTGLSVE